MIINKDAFLKVYREFKLGSLTTEGINPLTKKLSSLAQKDVSAAIACLQKVDRLALESLEKKLELVYRLHADIKKTRRNGGKVFLSGCGATGRLSIALETFWRMAGRGDGVVGFMAGGDYALIKSVERFEDKMSYGHRQLEELGFGNKDLLVAVTEGGETSFVIGSALWARGKSEQAPYFLYCNPDEELMGIERSRAVLEDGGIEKLNLTVGPMAISGSTRMQATTVQMLALALALFLDAENCEEFVTLAKREIEGLKDLELSGLGPFIVRESAIYERGGRVSYMSDPACAITLLTDTTERSPTFSLEAFEKQGEEHMSLAYLTLKNGVDSRDAWKKLLARQPRGLSWPDLDIKIDLDEIYKFDISGASVERRSGGELFSIEEGRGAYHFQLDELRSEIPIAGGQRVFRQIGLKMAMNILSTLIMGRIGRYEGNLMTYVRPSNFKLIDRAARYVLELGSQDGFDFEYLEVVEELFSQIPGLGPDEPVVLKTLQAMKEAMKASR